MREIFSIKSCPVLADGSHLTGCGPMREEAVLAVRVSPQEAFPSPTEAQAIEMTSSRAKFPDEILNSAR